MERLKSFIIPLIPGISAALFCVIISKILATYFLPTIGAATLSILIGILLGNTVFTSPQLAKGTKFSESKLLEVSVVLLGLTVTVQTITQLGWSGLVFILLQITITLLAAEAIGRRLKFNSNMRRLMAGGNAVCGSSAIASIAPAIGASEEEKGQIITLVNLQGTVMMLTLPFLALYLWPSNLLVQSALIGGTLQSVGQVVAGASLMSAEHIQYAMLFKIMRIMSLVGVVFLFNRLARSSNPSESLTSNMSSPHIKKGIPWYVMGFLVACFINSTLPLPSVFATTSHIISSWFELTALAAIGLRLNLKHFLKEGWQFLIYALSVGIVQVVTAITLIYLLMLHSFS
ncbi:YeiH family protein [Atopobacter phocae]|uniref:YeiH family protein n=1 Tax=Atopobacter phocae TaxID=136492 RepID=UPI0004712209|nr:putative sulfate exporter family transporter [Atopobacter phocae]